VCRDKKHHSFLRRIANPFFSPSFLRELEPTIQRYYKLFINGIKADGEQNGGIVDLTKWIDHVILDVTFDPYARG
jgi:cytochrome P450